MAYPDWTYEQYLEQYEQWESTIEAGEYGYYSRGKHVKCDIPKLTQAEFEQHKASLEVANRNFDTAHKAQNLEAMDKALSESFPHELVLLV
jgi:hypothetical protein